MKRIKFYPQLTHKDMLKLGIFGGYYFEEKHNEYPKDLFNDAELSNTGYDVNLNCFKIDSPLLISCFVVLLSPPPLPLVSFSFFVCSFDFCLLAHAGVAKNIKN